MSRDSLERVNLRQGVQDPKKGATLEALMEVLDQATPALNAIAAAVKMTVPRLTLTPEEAAESLGVSRDSFDRYVKPELKVVRRGRIVLVPISELTRWVNENAQAVLE